ncbi:MAG: hypothetical protein GTO55_03085 [Armatimonadetes bacterium]|nr:hypothetical protein [Armatimonadota bacterium]NIM23260.1 hypothetical protein [Armatimonadota bacterium]NIM67128.1 hypothetical protein [Armatimonadota bacterium]NIM75655.1 hypothetical protein [Armatimonadota bacterium]NIN05317.1 hypothetical protein [Armatimonadota bacterium]
MAPASRDTQRPFRFIVLGDSRAPWHFLDDVQEGRMEPFQPEGFRQIIAEANLLRPSFVIDVGDLILGYSAPDLTEREWDNYLETITASERPFISVVGNHDVWNTASAETWKRRIGPLYFSFDYGNSHFICLDSEESRVLGDEGAGVISDEQISWLKMDLEANKHAQNIFVFQHEPFFLAEEYPESNWPAVHNMLKQYPVRAVFVGHWHQYGKYDARDGIEYVITGGGGAEVYSAPELGNFHHYLLVEVDGSNIDWVVIKPGAVLSREVVNESLLREVAAAKKRIQISPAIEPYLDVEAPQSISVTVENPLDSVLETKITWVMPGDAWKMEPAETEVNIAPQGKQTFLFNLQVDNKRWLAGELPELEVELPLREGEIRLPINKALELEEFALQCPRVERPLQIDGDLSDWEGTRGIVIQPEMTDTWSPESFYGGFRLMWDEHWLYIAGEIWDDEFTMPRRGSDDSSPGDIFGLGGGNMDCRFLLLEGKPTLLHKKEAQDYHSWKEAQVAISRKGALTIYEAAVPIDEALEAPYSAGTTFEIGVYCSDQDGEKKTPNWMWTEVETQLR